MTVTTSTSSVTYTGNGATTSFAYTFDIPDSNSIVVTITDTSGNVTTLSSSQYTVSGLGVATGGTVTYPTSGSPLAAGWHITIQRVVAVVQNTDIVNQSGFYPQVIESALDYLTWIAQQLNTSQAVMLKVPVTDGTVGTLPAKAARANQILGFDSNGNPIVAQPSSALVSSAMQPVVDASSIAAANALLGILTWASGGTVPDGQLLANISGATAGPSFSTLSGILDHIVSSTRGALLVRGASGWSPLAPPSVTGAEFIWNGTDPVWSPTPLAHRAATGLIVQNNGITPNTKVDITATAAVLLTSTGLGYRWTGGTVTCDLTVNGANGLDTGTKTVSTWYHMYLISNGTAVAALASTSATAPTLPTGYTYYMRVGAVYVYSDGNLRRTRQLGKDVRYIITSGSANTTANINMAGSSASYWTAISTATFIPSTAVRIIGSLTDVTGAVNAAVAPNGSYGTANGGSNSPPLYINNGNTATYPSSAMFDFLLESSNIYWGGSGYVTCMGWVDSVNAC